MFDLVKYTVLGTIARFKKEEDGVALTEYLVLLGLLVAGVIVSVVAFGGGLAAAWDTWTAWIGTAVNAPTTPASGG